MCDACLYVSPFCFYLKRSKIYRMWQKRCRKKIIFSIFWIQTHIFGSFGQISWNFRSIEIIAGEEMI